MSKEEQVIQAFGSLAASRLGLSEQVRHQSVAALNRLLAHTMAMRDLYKKSHWQTSGATFYELHLLFDKHYGEQVEIMDTLAERVQTLGGVTLALAHDVGARACRHSCAAWSRRTNSCSGKRGRWLARPRKRAMTAPMTSSWANSSAPTSCRAGSSVST